MANLELWRKIYALSDEFFALKPWEFLTETDIFGVKSPDSNKTYYISIIGGMGEVYALSAYEGAEGLYRFWNMEDEDEELPPEYILFIPHVMVSLDDRENVPEKQREVIKQLGLKYRGKQSWVNIRQIIPGFIPGTPDDQHIEDMVHILSQSIEVIKRAKENPDLIYTDEQDEDEYLLRIAKPKDDGYEWEDHYQKVNRPAPEENYQSDLKKREAFASLPAGPDVIETDLVMIPAPVDNKNEAPYYPFMFIMVDPQSGMVLDFALLNPLPDLQTMIGKFPDILFDKFIQQDKRPQKIKYKSPFIEGAMDFIEEQTGQKTERHTHLHGIDEAVDNLLNQL